RASVRTLKTIYTNLLDLLPSELIPSIIKNLPIQDLKNCCSLDDIWKDEVIRKIRKRLIVDCKFVDNNIIIKTIINLKSHYSNISKALVKKLNCYISRDFGRSGYSTVKELGINVINSGKKIMAPTDLIKYYNSEYSETESESNDFETGVFIPNHY
ncbi:11647_t:CDS:2, partial [Diversispora eburnea]